MLDGLANWAADVMDTLGYTGIFLIIVAENIFPPIPSEAVLPLAGFLASDGRFWLPGVILASTAGAVVGALILYALGAWFGDDRVRWLIDRYGRWLAVSGRDLDRANAWFDKHGPIAVMICRIVPIVRSLVSIPAGLRRMNLASFIVYTAIGAGIWNCVLVGAGWWLGDNWEEVGTVIDYVQYPLIILAVVAIVVMIVKRKIAAPRKTSRTAAE